MASDSVGRRERELEVRRAVGDRIRELRRAKGVNQDDFADLAGVHRSHVGMLENAKLDPRLSTLVRVADALGVGVPELLVSIEPNPG